MPTNNASFFIPANAAIASGMQIRPALSTVTPADLLPINRRNASAFWSPNCIELSFSASFCIRLGGRTSRLTAPGVVRLGHGIKVNSASGCDGRHFAGTWVRRFSSTPCLNED